MVILIIRNTNNKDLCKRDSLIYKILTFTGDYHPGISSLILPRLLLTLYTLLLICVLPTMQLYMYSYSSMNTKK